MLIGSEQFRSFSHFDAFDGKELKVRSPKAEIAPRCRPPKRRGAASHWVVSRPCSASDLLFVRCHSDFGLRIFRPHHLENPQFLATAACSGFFSRPHACRRNTFGHPAQTIVAHSLPPF